MLNITVHQYPVDAAKRAVLIDLLQQVFPRTDVDWLQSMRGVYADVLTTCNVVGSIDGQPVGCASVAFAVDRPEVCVIEDVITLPAARGRGVARTLTEHAVSIGFDAGCKVAYLGNTPTASSVYEKVGFTRIKGVFMRRAAPGQEGYELAAFAPQQTLHVRETNWGDLPGVVCLMAQPTGPMLAHYDLGLASLRDVQPQRAVSNFTSVKYATENAGGCMWSLVSDTSPHRILGFASATPGAGPLRNATARCDITCHDHYAPHAAALINAMIDWAAQHHIKTLDAFVAACDTTKRAWFEAAGFQFAAHLPNGLTLDQQTIGVDQLQKHER